MGNGGFNRDASSQMQTLKQKLAQSNNRSTSRAFILQVIENKSINGLSGFTCMIFKDMFLETRYFSFVGFRTLNQEALCRR